MRENKFEPIRFDARGVPISERFDDPYFSFQNGLDESQYVFLQGNRLDARLSDGFHIGELGFGSGLNFFATWMLWDRLGGKGKIRFTSFEAFPMNSAQRTRTLIAFEALKAYVERFERGFDGAHYEDERIDLTVITGDARKEVARWSEKADAWYLDGFSPAKNPELWEASLMADVYAHTQRGGSFATYTAAGFVRKNLSDAGFQIERIKGFAHKRHMTRGVRSHSATTLNKVIS